MKNRPGSERDYRNREAVDYRDQVLRTLEKAEKDRKDRETKKPENTRKR